MDKENADRISDIVRANGLALHKYLKHGHVEKVYENGLKHRLENAGIQVTQQFPITVTDEDDFSLGEFFADLVAESEIIIELKAVKAITDERVAQLLGYLRATGKEYSLPANFRALKFFIKRFILSS